MATTYTICSFPDFASQEKLPRSLEHQTFGPALLALAKPQSSISCRPNRASRLPQNSMEFVAEKKVSHTEQPAFILAVELLPSPIYSLKLGLDQASK